MEECEQALRNARKSVSKAGKELGEAHNLVTEHTGDRSVTLRSLDEMFQSMRDSKDYYTNALDEAHSSIEILKEEAGARRSRVDELGTNLDVAQSRADEAEIALKNMTGKYHRLQRDSGDKNRQLASANQKQEAKNEDLFGDNVRLCGRVEAFESESQEKSEIIGILVDMVCSDTGNVYTTEQFSQLLAGRQMGKDLIDRFVSFEPDFTPFMEAPVRSTTTSEDKGLSRTRKYDAVETLSAECTDVSEMDESTPSSPSEKLSGDTSDAPRTAVEMGHHQSTSSETSSIGSTILFKPRGSNSEIFDRE